MRVKLLSNHTPQRLPLFYWEMSPWLLSTGWIQEQIWACVHNQTELNRGFYCRLFELSNRHHPHSISSKPKLKFCRDHCHKSEQTPSNRYWITNMRYNCNIQNIRVLIQRSELSFFDQVNCTLHVQVMTCRCDLWFTSVLPISSDVVKYIMIISNATLST